MAARETDVLVIGSGIAGCAAALACVQAGADVTLLTKAERPEGSSSYWAQGGIAVARGDPEAFAADVLEASDGSADPGAVETLVGAADSVVSDVLVDTVGVEFDGGSDPEYGREAAHSESRILHVDASTGKHVLVPFLTHLEGLGRVDIVEDAAALDLLTAEGRVHGAVVERSGEVESCFAGSTVLATGGIGACYRRTTNPATATGDGIAMAALAGAETADMEYVQFHPTAFADGGTGENRGTFLLSEAVRGDGALLRNGDGERFMPEYHADAELAPRDVVARAVRAERDRTGDVRLDVSSPAAKRRSEALRSDGSPLRFEESFPTLAAECHDRGVDPAEGIPVAPAEHFVCGGIDVDNEGRTSLDGLFAVGECARTGVHGANRLASTSLLEALVWGTKAGAAAAGRDPIRIGSPRPRDTDPGLPEGFAAGKFLRLRRVMDEYVGIERSPTELDRAAGRLRRLKGEIDAYTRTRTSRSLYELRNACVAALLVTRAARDNRESRGCHYLTPEASADAD